MAQKGATWRLVPKTSTRSTSQLPAPKSSARQWATLGGNEDACIVLLDAGAKLDRKNRLKETVVDYAVKYERVKLKVKYESMM